MNYCVGLASLQQINKFPVGVKGRSLQLLTILIEYSFKEYLFIIRYFILDFYDPDSNIT
jgi:hypothetical protein